MTRLVAVGDLVLGDSASTIGFGFNSTHQQNGLEPVLGRVTEVLRSGDIVFGNLEAVLSEGDGNRTTAVSLHMRASPRFAGQLRRAGFTVLNVANNHANQHGDQAFADTCRHLLAAGIAVSGLPGTDGWSSQPLLLESHPGQPVGLLAYSLQPRQYHADRVPPFAEGNPEGILADVRRLRHETGTVVVSMHWGLEFTSQPSTSQVALAHDILAAGACLVLGHHAHVVQPFVDTGAGAIAFGLGNFLSDMLWDDALRRGAILTCSLTEGTVREATIADTYLDATGTPSITGHRRFASSAEVPGVPDHEYGESASGALARLRRAKARYLIRNFYRMKPRFAIQWVARVIRNRLPVLL